MRWRIGVQPRSRETLPDRADALPGPRRGRRMSLELGRSSDRARRQQLRVGSPGIALPQRPEHARALPGTQLFEESLPCRDASPRVARAPAMSASRPAHAVTRRRAIPEPRAYGAARPSATRLRFPRGAGEIRPPNRRGLEPRGESRGGQRDAADEQGGRSSRDHTRSRRGRSMKTVPSERRANRAIG